MTTNETPRTFIPDSPNARLPRGDRREYITNVRIIRILGIKFWIADLYQAGRDK